MNTVDNVKEVTSTSTDNLSVITLKFNWGSNLDEATNQMRDVIDRVYDYMPEDVDRPTILKFNTSMMPIVFMPLRQMKAILVWTKFLKRKLLIL